MPANIISVYDEIMSFKDQMQGILPKLVIRCYGKNEIQSDFGFHYDEDSVDRLICKSCLVVI